MFPPALQEGERGSAICTIRSGERPLEFQWKKDNEDISETSNIKIQSVPDSSILVIESVTSKSSGNYTCIVKNSFGRDQFTAVLTVTGLYIRFNAMKYLIFISVLIYFYENIEKLEY